MSKESVNNTIATISGIAVGSVVETSLSYDEAKHYGKKKQHSKKDKALHIVKNILIAGVATGIDIGVNAIVKTGLDTINN